MFDSTFLILEDKAHCCHTESPSCSSDCCWEKFFLNISKVIYSFIIPVHLKFPDLLDLMDLAF